LGWSTSDEKIGLSLWVKNLLNEKTMVFATSALAGTVYAAGAPRTYGIEATFNF